jgi:hypothetical protein
MVGKRKMRDLIEREKVLRVVVVVVGEIRLLAKNGRRLLLDAERVDRRCSVHREGRGDNERVNGKNVKLPVRIVVPIVPPMSKRLHTGVLILRCVRTRSTERAADPYPKTLVAFPAVPAQGEVTKGTPPFFPVAVVVSVGLANSPLVGL